MFTASWATTKQLFSRKSHKKYFSKQIFDPNLKQGYSQSSFDSASATLHNDNIFATLSNDNESWLGDDLISLTSSEQQFSTAYSAFTPTHSERARVLMNTILSQEIDNKFAGIFSSASTFNLEHEETAKSHDLDSDYESLHSYLEFQSENESSNHNREWPTINQSEHRDQARFEPIYMENLLISDDLFQEPQEDGLIYMENIVIDDHLFTGLFRQNHAAQGNIPPISQMVNEEEDIYEIYSVPNDNSYSSASIYHRNNPRASVDTYENTCHVASQDVCARNNLTEDLFEEIYFENETSVQRRSLPISFVRALEFNQEEEIYSEPSDDSYSAARFYGHTAVQVDICENNYHASSLDVCASINLYEDIYEEITFENEMPNHHG
jgi:hypothetical protein